ncbi:MAG: DUF2851 family protein [Paludibacteraceae bacterium]
MNESILHYIWQYKLFPQHQLKTIDGDEMEVIDCGLFNSDAGPDFFNAKIKIDGTVWAGNIEFHQRSSDWKRHRHSNDKAYDNVILHIAENVDTDVFRTNGERIPQMELKIPEHIKRNYDELLANKKWISCEDKISQVESIRIATWKDTLLTERLEQKTELIFQLLEQTENHWEEAFYISLARSFGFGINGLPFEMTAKSLPLNVLAKHKDNLFQLEALLLGQAGLLEQTDSDEYQLSLQKEYRFLQTKYNLTPIAALQWKLLRLRPDNFPHIRLAQFSKLIHKSTKLFSKILEIEHINDLRKIFQSEVSDYWTKHYLFGKESPSSKKTIGNSSIDVLLINTVVPFLFAYGRKKNEETYIEKAFRLLETLPAENNSVIAKWHALNINAANAFDSQALLQLKKIYCDEKKCLRCRIGRQILTLK